MNKTLLFRQDGYLFALTYLRTHTADQLDEEIRMREKTGIKTILTFDELNADKGLEYMTGFVHQAQNVMWCIALRKMGFGRERILRNLNRVMERQPKTVQEAYRFREENNRKLHDVLHTKRYEDGVPGERIPSRSTMEYIKVREEGLSYALDIVRKKGMFALRKLITRTNFNKNMVIHENEYANDIIRGIYNEAKILEWLISLHELEKFGDHRLNRCMDEFEAAYAKLLDGREGYENYLDEIQKVTGQRLPEDWLKEDTHYPMIRHKKKKAKKKKVTPQKPKAEERPPIEEPDEFTSYPCLQCPSKARCREESYKGSCTCLALYKEIRREHVRKNTA